jgi:zinc transport system permease protein
VTPGYAPDLMSYLFGSLLFVSWKYVAITAALDAAILAVVALLGKELQAVAFDEEFAEVAGLPVERLLLLLLALISLAIVVLIRVVGAILVIALLTLPGASARPWATGLPRMLALSVAISATATLAGLALSLVLSDVAGVSAPPGPLIILVATLIYGLSVALHRLLSRGA